MVPLSLLLGARPAVIPRAKPRNQRGASWREVLMRVKVDLNRHCCAICKIAFLSASGGANWRWKTLWHWQPFCQSE
jgi:hypothetical protein